MRVLGDFEMSKAIRSNPLADANGDRRKILKNKYKFLLILKIIYISGAKHAPLTAKSEKSQNPQIRVL